MSRTERPPRFGVLGGTFDPIHNGHLHIAAALRSALGLDRVIWVPAGRPPHKTGQIVSSDRDRLAMLRLALHDSPLDEISTIDLDRKGPSYSADMLELLKARNSPAHLVFLMGEDSLRDFPTWREPERIVRAAELAVAGRPGVDADLEVVRRAVPEIEGRVHVIPVTELAVSSSDVRRRVAEAQPISGLVPPAVESYIQERGLYQPARSSPSAIR